MCSGFRGGLCWKYRIPLPGNEIKICNVDTREEVPYGGTGEICICGPTVMPGYLDNEKETNDILEMDKKEECGVILVI